MKLLMTPLKLHLAIDRTLFFFFFSLDCLPFYEKQEDALMLALIPLCPPSKQTL